MKHGKIVLSCDFCGKALERYPSQVKKHNFCNRKCLANFSSKTQNPQGYLELKSYTNMSDNMKRLNAILNPSRMTVEVRTKLRNSRLGKGKTDSYEKLYGRHTHRIVAELMLGRALEPGEVVHHVDGNKRNNSPQNLRIFSSQAEHAAWHKENEGKKVVSNDVQTS